MEHLQKLSLTLILVKSQETLCWTSNGENKAQAGENWKGAVVLLSKWKMTPAEISLQVVYTDSCGCWKGCAVDVC